MVRFFILLVLAGSLALLAAPFLISSLYVDQRGIAITGRVYSKSEVVTVRYSGWSRYSEVTVEYWPPDQAGVSFFNTRLDPDHYDALAKGETVNLKYLRQADIPAVPMAKVLRQIHALPTVRLSGQRAFSGLEMTFTPRVIRICELIGGIAILLFIWRRAGWMGFWWALGVCVVAGVAALLIQDFPMPMPRPVTDLRQGSGRVQSIGRIDRLFEGSHERGAEAAQPVDVVAVEFVPEGRQQPVVAVDLIDEGSLPGLKENATVGIEYEGGSPRTAYIQRATRGFAGRNLSGVGVDAAVLLIVIAALFAAAHFIGRACKRLIQPRA